MRTIPARIVVTALVAGPALLGCAATLPPPPAPPASVTVAAAVVDAPTPPVDETPAATCEKPDGDDGGCFVSEAYRSWLCGRGDPTAAIAMFHKGTAWTRAYVSRDLESWDPGRRSQKSHLSLDEEVVILHPYKPSSGVVVVGSTNAQGWTSADAVRADGTCVSLMADEFTSKRPPAPKHATIAWDKLNEHARSELLVSPELRKKADQMTKACANGSSVPGCAKAKSKLTDAVVAL